MLHVGISPGIFLLFCMAVCYPRLLSLGMAVCDYASLLTLIQPIQMNATFFGKNVPKIIFAIMGGFQNKLRNSSIPGPPLGKLGPLQRRRNIDNWGGRYSYIHVLPN